MSTKDLIKAGITLYFVIIMLFLVTAPAFADQWTIKVIGFDFETEEVIFEDEDGYLWACEFGENSWAVGEEYILVIDGDNIFITE